MDQREGRTIGRTMLTLAIMLLGPPLVLVGLVLAEVMPFREPAADWGAVALLWAMGIAALAWSRWPRPGHVCRGGCLYNPGRAGVAACRAARRLLDRRLHLRSAKAGQILASAGTTERTMSVKCA